MAKGFRMKKWVEDFYIKDKGVYCPLCGKFFTKRGIHLHIAQIHCGLDCSWNRGLTKDTDKNVKRITDRLLKNYKINGGTFLGRKHSKETKEKLSKIKIKNLDKIHFYSKRSKINGVWLDSSYELKFAKEMNKNGILWERPKKCFKWKDGSGQNRNYLPDFYLPKFDVYIDTKNPFLIKKDRNKIENVIRDNNINLIIIGKEDIIWKRAKEIIKILA